MKNRNDEPKLTDDEEELVAMIFSSYSDELVTGRNPSIKEFEEKLPETCRVAFRRVANMEKFLIAIMQEPKND